MTWLDMEREERHAIDARRTQLMAELERIQRLLDTTDPHSGAGGRRRFDGEVSEDGDRHMGPGPHRPDARGRNPT